MIRLLSNVFLRRAPVVPVETPLERRIVNDPEWVAGAQWGKPRRGHPEGSVAAHVRDVLANVDAVALDERDRQRLRLVALVHDSFKHRVDRSRPRTGDNHHGTIARRFAERYLEDAELLDVIELHDEAYNAWRRGGEARALRLVERLGPSVDFYLRFYRADNGTRGKDSEPREWFEQVVERAR